MFFVVLWPGTPEGSTRSGSGFKASQKTGQRFKVLSDRLGEAGIRTCDPWFTRHRFIPFTTAASPYKYMHGLLCLYSNFVFYIPKIYYRKGLFLFIVLLAGALAVEVNMNGKYCTQMKTQNEHVTPSLSRRDGCLQSQNCINIVSTVFLCSFVCSDKTFINTIRLRAKKGPAPPPP